MNEKLKDLNEVQIKTYKINAIVYHEDKFKPTIIVESKVESVSIDINEDGVPIVEYRLQPCKDDDYHRSGVFHHEDLFLTPKDALNDKIEKLNKKYDGLLEDIKQKFNEMYTSENECYESAMEMKKWKDEQSEMEKQVLINKACEWLEPIFQSLVGYFNAVDLINDFKEVMKED